MCEASSRGAAEGPRDHLRTADAYRLWAPSYEEETAVSALEDRLVRSVMPDVRGQRLLDVGCGTGRRIRSLSGAPALAVGVDLVPDMLRYGRRAAGTPLSIAGDVRHLPLRTAEFDLLWCRLVLGHVVQLSAAYAELARVARPGAALIVSDFHATAVAAGHTRTFRDALGRVREVEHCVHPTEDHIASAGAGGWAHASTLEAPAGRQERPFYERADRVRQFEEEADLPLVLVLCYRR